MVRDGWDKTPLQATSYGGHLAIGKQLLDRGADVGSVTRDNVGWTSLYLAAAYGQSACSSGQRTSIPDTRKVQQISINGMPGLVQSLLEHDRMGTCTTNMAEPARSLRVNQHAKNKSNNT
jgi:hypothetical protein